MKKEFIYCDYCGVRINNKNQAKLIKLSFLARIFDYPFFQSEYITEDSEACEDCYKSYLKWKLSRKTNKGE